MYQIHCGCFLIVFTLVLRLWYGNPYKLTMLTNCRVKAIPKLQQAFLIRLLPYFVSADHPVVRFIVTMKIYPSVILMVMMLLYTGAMWYSPMFFPVHNYCMMYALIVCGIGYIVFGMKNSLVNTNIKQGKV